MGGKRDDDDDDDVTNCEIYIRPGVHGSWMMMTDHARKRTRDRGQLLIFICCHLGWGEGMLTGKRGGTAGMRSLKTNAGLFNLLHVTLSPAP